MSRPAIEIEEHDFRTAPSTGAPVIRRRCLVQLAKSARRTFAERSLVAGRGFCLLNDRAADTVGLLLGAAVFMIDLLLPRGPAPAIGYCAVVVLVGGAHKRHLFGMAALYSVLTWVGHLLEPPGASLGMAILNRGAVTAVIWITAILTLSRQRAAATLARRNEELARVNTELDQFAGAVAHDLRSPLSTVLSGVQLMRREVGSCESSGELLDTICRGAREMQETIDRLLAFARSGATELRCVRVELGELLRDVERKLSAELLAANACIRHQSLPAVRGDPALLGIVLQNLIENAVKYRADVPPQIYVGTHRRGDEWIVTIRDNGSGIPEHLRERVFELGNRGDQRRSTGSGLGLATCRKIIGRHGGQIWVVPSGDQGTTIAFALPIHSC